jgi:hypothetical protein
MNVYAIVRAISPVCFVITCNLKIEFDHVKPS